MLISFYTCAVNRASRRRRPDSSHGSDEVLQNTETSFYDKPHRWRTHGVKGGAATSILDGKTLAAVNIDGRAPAPHDRLSANYAAVAGTTSGMGYDRSAGKLYDQERDKLAVIISTNDAEAFLANETYGKNQLHAEGGVSREIVGVVSGEEINFDANLKSRSTNHTCRSLDLGDRSAHRGDHLTLRGR